MATQRYTVPPQGGHLLGVPGIWAGGEEIEFDDATREVRILNAPAAEETPDAAPEDAATPRKKSVR